MDLFTFVRALVRRWYITAILLVVALCGATIYRSKTDSYTAGATVAVLDPLISRPGLYLQAELSFDNIVTSHQLAERVAGRLHDGTTPDAVSSATSIETVKSLSLSTSPLYIVKVKDRNKARAILLANTVVEESKALFTELNQTNPDDVTQSYASQTQKLQDNVNTARDRWISFEQDNDAFDLPDRLKDQETLVAQLRSVQSDLKQGPAVIAALGLPQSSIPAWSRSSGPPTSTALDEARAKLSRLTALEPEYSRLTSDLQLAQDQVKLLESRTSGASPGSAGGTSALDGTSQQLAAAQARESSAQAAYSAFQKQTGMPDLSAAIQSERAQMDQLALTEAATGTDGLSLQQEITSEQQELSRLGGLEQQYNDLELQYAQAQQQLTTLENSELTASIGDTIPVQSLVRQLDAATIQSNFWDTILKYALSLMAAVFLAVTIVYLLTFFEGSPLGVEELQRELGAPVLIRLPAATARRRS
jgi:capsular polysaccharide biosynthesis protein